MASVLKTVAEAVKTFRQDKRPKPMTREEYFALLQSKGLNPDGSPILDPTPMAPPIGYKKHPSMVEIVRDMVRSERLAAEAATSGHETFEESEDFDVGDEPEVMKSGWENDFDPPLEQLLAAGRAALAEKEARKSVLPPVEPPNSGVQGAVPPAKGKRPSAPPEAPDEP